MIEFRIDDKVARITLSHAPVNAMSPELIGAIIDELDRLRTRSDWQVLVIASSLKVFCAGGELAVMRGWMDQPDGGKLVSDYSRRVQQLCQRIEALPQITVVECVGSAIGGGLELALACDLRIVSSKAKFGCPEVGLGLLPAAGGTQRITRLCGKGTAARMIFGAEVVDADLAFQFGLVQWVFSPDEFKEKSAVVLARLASLPRQALMQAKECIGLALADSGDAGFAKEIFAISVLASTDETRERVSEFLNVKRE